jgi:hypothetical protein
MHTTSLADSGMRGTNEILSAPPARVNGDRRVVVCEYLAEPEPVETRLRSIDDDDTRRTMLVEQPEKLLERRCPPVELVVDGDLKPQNFPRLRPDEGYDCTGPPRTALQLLLETTDRVRERLALTNGHAPLETPGARLQPREIPGRMPLIASGGGIRIDVRRQYGAG